MNIYFISSIPRSGTHLLSSIIQHSYGLCLYRNDCGIDPVSKVTGIGQPYEIEVYEHGILKSKIGKRFDGSLVPDSIIFSTEIAPLAVHDFCSYESCLTSVSELKKIFKVDIDFFNVWNFRDPRNMVASQIKYGLPNVDKLLDVQYQHLSNLEDKTLLNFYDKIISDSNYFRKICKKLKIDEVRSLKAFDKISYYGGGSSFEKFKKQTVDKYLERYLQIEMSEEVKSLVDRNYLVYQEVVKNDN